MDTVHEVGDGACAQGRWLHGLAPSYGGLDLGQYREIHAYGDTAEDREMLALANRRYYRWKEADEYEPAS